VKVHWNWSRHVKCTLVSQWESLYRSAWSVGKYTQECNASGKVYCYRTCLPAIGWSSLL